MSKTSNSTSDSFSQNFGIIIIGALVFIVSFLWKDFITDIEHIFLPNHDNILGRFLYILVVTLMIVYLIVMIRNYLGLNKNAITNEIDSPDDIPDDI
jgi:hypothetical protein